jgi:hypothetical protein
MQNVLISRYILKPNKPHYIDAVCINNSLPAASRFSFLPLIFPVRLNAGLAAHSSTGCARYVLLPARNRNKFPTVLTKQHNHCTLVVSDPITQYNSTSLPHNMVNTSFNSTD